MAFAWVTELHASDINMFNYAFELEGTKPPLLDFFFFYFYKNLDPVLSIKKAEENPIHIRSEFIRIKKNGGIRMEIKIPLTSFLSQHSFQSIQKFNFFSNKS